MTGAHQERAHAVLSASSAKQWLACPPSIRASEGAGDRTSQAALEGTFAHELSELHFERLFNGMHGRTFNSKLKKMKENNFYNAELDEYVQEYVDFVTERVNLAKARDEESLVLMFETALDLSTYVPESFGTGDVIIYSGGMLEIIDLKYGKGIAVTADNNPQLRLYALGATELIEMMADVEKVSMWIHQPRKQSVTNEELTVDQLKAWGTQYVKPRALQAFKGEGEYKAGDHCVFCKIKTQCKTRANYMMQSVEDMKDPNLLTNEEIADLLFKVDEIAKWAKDIKDFALMQANGGEIFEGWKLVAGRSRRVITDTDKAIEALSLVYEETDILEPSKLKSIGALEKSIGKKSTEELIGHLIMKPDGAPTLVEESDKRPAINDPMSEFDEIKEDT
ncbi:DUF2800 domain-containing protein [Macrococcus capreoli]|uniref:DUF2800 domain-containing protein n=1 Tax=Macrococcus capreoli TaxID=2982690 RepID=UPI003EE75921